MPRRRSGAGRRRPTRNKKAAGQRNTAGLVATARTKAEETRKRVTAAVDQLVAEERPVNFNAVAKEAGVTKGYLYKQNDLRERIAALRVAPGHGRLRVMTGGVHGPEQGRAAGRQGQADP